MELKSEEVLNILSPDDACLLVISEERLIADEKFLTEVLKGIREEIIKIGIAEDGSYYLEMDAYLTEEGLAEVQAILDGYYEGNLSEGEQDMLLWIYSMRKRIDYWLEQSASIEDSDGNDN